MGDSVLQNRMFSQSWRSGQDRLSKTGISVARLPWPWSEGETLQEVSPAPGPHTLILC